jgi:hypothetical protein
VLVESPIGNVPIVNPDPGGPQAVREVDGVRWAGFRDLLVKPTRAECERLGLPYGPALLIDYKTSANVGRYALTPETLRDDLQACLYALSTCEDFEQDETPARWVYFETKKVRRAKAVDATISRDHALHVIAPCNTRARELDSLTEVAQATKNPLACGDYGRTCEFHKSVGGPCDARRSIGALVQARVVKKEPNMALDQATKDRLANMKNKFNKAAEPPPEDAAEDTSEDTTAEEAPAEETPPPAEEKPKPALAKPKLAPKTPAAAADKPAPAAKPSKLATLAAKYDAKEAELAAIGAEIAALVGG